MPTEDFRLRFIADMQSLEAGLRTGGTSATEAKKRIGVLTTAYSAAEKAAGAAGKAAKDGEKQIGSALKAIEGLGRSVGGPLGAATGLLGDFADTAEGAGGALGVAGIAAAGAASAIVAIGLGAAAAYAAMDSLADSTRRAIERLEQITGAEEAASGAAAAVQAWEQAELRLEATTARLTTEIGAGLLPVAAELLQHVVDVVVALRDADAAMDGWADTSTRARVIFGVTTLGMSELAIAGNRMARSTDESREALVDMSVASEEQKRQAAQVTELELRRAAAERALAGDLKYRETAERDATRAASEAERAAQKSADAARERGKMLLEAQQMVDDEQRDLALRAIERQAEVGGAMADLTAAGLEEFTAKFSDAIAKLEGQMMAQQTANRSLTDSIVGGVGQVAGAYEGLAQRGSAAYAVLFALQQGAALAGIAVDTQRAIMAGFAQFGPPPSPAGIAAAAAAVISGTAAAATVAATTISAFPTGGTVPPDHGLAAVAPGESVLNRSATRRMGEQQVNDLNRGTAQAGGGQVLQLRYGPRVLEEVLVDSLARPGASRAAVRRAAGASTSVVGRR